MDLKDYKRVSNGSEFRDVVQISDSEPRFRSNGHELVLSSSNGDTVAVPLDFTMTDGTYIEFRAFSSEESIQPIYSSGANEYVVLNFPSGNRLFIFCNGKGNNILAGQVLINTWHTIRLYRESGTNYAQVDNGTAEAFTNSATDLLVLNASDLILNNLNTTFGDISLDYIDFNGDKFEAVNINENGQIVSTNGTIAQVNSSAADPINYILGTVFQKSGFALEFDSSNSEYILLPLVQTLSEDGDYLEISFTLNELTATSIVSETNTGDYATILADGRIFINTGSGDSLNTLVVNDLDNVVRITRTATGLDVTLNGVTEVSTLTTDFNYGQFFRRSISYASGKIHYIKSNLENYPLRRGLGNKILKEGAEAVTALELNSANSDYVSVVESYNIINFSEIDVELNFALNSYDTGNQYYLALGSISSSLRGFCNILKSGTNQIRVQYSGKSLSNIGDFRVDANPFGEFNTVKIKNGVITINGFTKTVTDFQVDLDVSSFTVNSVGNGTQSSSASYTPFYFQGETFSVQEINSSAQIIGSEGTVAQVNTSAAGGTSYILDNIVTPNEATIISGSADADRINFGMWLSGNDTDGWNPYAKDNSGAEYYLDLSSLNQDAISMDDYTFQNGSVLEIKAERRASESFSYLFGKDGQRWTFISLQSTVFNYASGNEGTGQYKISGISIPDYGVYKIEYLNNVVSFFVDNVKLGEVTTNGETSVFNLAATRRVGEGMGTIKFYNMSIDGEKITVPSSGFDLISEGTFSANGQTSSADALNYWNQDVITEKI